jgi:hypothetical protein
MTNFLIGGTDPNAGNLIAHNNDPGIVVLNLENAGVRRA